jgi:hypothetical protein
MAGDLADRPPGGRRPSARRKLLSDSLRKGTDHLYFGVCLRFSDCLLEGHEPSAQGSRTVRRILCRVAKSFSP